MHIFLLGGHEHNICSIYLIEPSHVCRPEAKMRSASGANLLEEVKEMSDTEEYFRKRMQGGNL